jgi:hypothetical protein
VFLLSIPVAAIAPYVAVAMWVLTFPVRLAVPRPLGRPNALED